MDSLELLNEFEKILTSDVELKDYYADSLSWIAARKADWRDDKIRVGVIGVTSSGKSTLLNVIMGREILPCAVVPSTGQIISCSAGTELSATVKFNDGTTKVIEGNELTQESLMEYSDQRRNPYNTKNVNCIELKTPYFQMGNRVVLIDSPGLDAYGMEAAERMTLETLIPTLDACIFVTTMKSNNDKKVAEVLTAVARYNCPLLIVQNMLDTLKPSPRGDKSREQKAKENYQRLEKLIENSEIRDKERVKIVQMSAENARKWLLAKSEKEKDSATKKKYQASQYDIFIRIMKDFLEQQVLGNSGQPKQDSVEEYISRLIEDLRPYCMRNRAKLDDEFRYTSLREEMTAFGNKIENDYKEIAKSYSKSSKELRAEIQSTGFSYNIDSYIKKTNKIVNQVGTSILEIIRTGNDYLFSVADKLNIPLRNLLRDPDWVYYRDIELERGSISGGRKSSGLMSIFGKLKGNSSKGGSSNDGNVPGGFSKNDIDANRRKIIMRLGEALYKYDEEFERWHMSAKSAIEKLLSSIDVAEKAYNARLSAELQKGKLLKVYDGLEQLLQRSAEANSLGAHSELYFGEMPETVDMSTSEVHVSPVSSEVIRMSTNAVRRQHNEILKQFIIKERLMDATPVVIGWDPSSVDELMWQLGVKDAMVMDLSKHEYRDLPIPGKRCFFILVNAIQFGAAQKQIYDLGLEKSLTEDDFVFWVLQDAEELINGDNLVEGLKCMLELKKNPEYRFKSIIWLIHNNPVYNIVFLEHQYQASNLLRDDNLFLRQIKEKYGVYCDDTVMEAINEMIKRVHV